MKMVTCKFAQDEVTHQRLLGRFKKHALSLAEGVRPARTPLADFFNRPS